uniref:Decapping nuclease n=1 Tax=Tetranychus urticae TaxID=32264 RepID=T1KUD1_TETUR
MPTCNIQTIRNIVIHSFIDLNQLRRDEDDNVSLEGPKKLGYFSCYDNNNDSVFSQDISALRYLDLPDPVNINCLQGYDPNKKYGHVVSRDMLLLRWVLDNEATIQKFTCDFICNNGIMKDMMVVKYAGCDWNLSGIKIRGKIVLNKAESFEKKERIATQSEKDNQSTYAAFNLQRLITKNNNCSECSSGKENDSLYGVFHSKIGSHRLLHAGWLHCVESEQELDKPFEEMKFILIKKFNAPKESHSLWQSNTWWSLAKLAGVDTVVRAKCDQDFTVEKIDKLKVECLINKRFQMTCVASLNKVLDFIKTIVTEENKCYNFSFNAKDKKLTGYMKIGSDENLIPSWYTDVQLSKKS